MNKRFLVKYIYKGKVFSVAFSEGAPNKHFQIGKKLTVGSDPSLLWQVYNPSFPKKHDLIINDNGKYYFNLLKSFSIRVKKGDKELSADELKSLGILKNERLYLSEEYQGEVILDENTTIAFFAIPKPAALTQEEKKLIALLNKWPAISTQQKVTRFTIVSVILFIIIFASIVGWTYTPPREKNIFDRVEENTMVSMQVSASVELPEEEVTFFEEEEVVTEEGEGEAEAKAQQEAQERAAQKQEIENRIAARRQANRSSSTDRYKNVANNAGSGQQGGTGTALAVRSRVRGLRGGSRAASSFDVEVDTESNYGAIAATLNRGKEIGSTAVAEGGVTSREIRGRKTARISSDGTTDLGKLASNLGDGNAPVETIGSKDIEGTDLKEGKIDVVEREVINLTDSQKETQVREWFSNALLPRITQEFDRYKLRKTIRGKLVFKLIFKNDKIVKAIIRGQGSINDKDFINRLAKLIEGKTYRNIGNYQIEISQRFE